MNPGSSSSNGGKVGLLSLPREVLGLIAEHIYDPLILTQQDRLSEFPYRTTTLTVLVHLAERKSEKNKAKYPGSMGDLLNGRHVR